MRIAIAFELAIDSKSIRFQLGRFRLIWDYRNSLVTKGEHLSMDEVNPKWPLSRSWHFFGTHMIVDLYGEFPA